MDHYIMPVNYPLSIDSNELWKKRRARSSREGAFGRALKSMRQLFRAGLWLSVNGPGVRPARLSKLFANRCESLT